MRHFLLSLPLGLVLLLSGCFVPIPLVATVNLPPSVAQSYPKHANPGPAPASARCPRPARADDLQKAVLAQVNAQRATAGLSALRINTALTRVAQAHACDNAARDSYGHVGSDGSDLGDRLRRGGIKLRVAAENTAINVNSADRAMQIWMGSAGHRANILNPKVTQIGLGVADGKRPVWVLDFLKPR